MTMLRVVWKWEWMCCDLWIPNKYECAAGQICVSEHVFKSILFCLGSVF